MTTAYQVTERALALARSGSEAEDAVADLLNCCAGKRVSVVIARQRLHEETTGTLGETSARAIEFLDLVLERGQWGME